MLAPLVSQMTMKNPADRPTATEALQHFRQIDNDVWAVHRLWRAQMRNEPYVARPILDAFSLVSQPRYTLPIASCSLIVHRRKVFAAYEAINPT